MRDEEKDSLEHLIPGFVVPKAISIPAFSVVQLLLIPLFCLSCFELYFCPQ